MSDGNFLFRLPGEFAEASPADGEVVRMTAGGDQNGARMALRILQIDRVRAARGAQVLGSAQALGQGLDQAGAPSWEGDRERSLATIEGRVGDVTALRFVLCVPDGDRLYLLTLDTWPRDNARVEALRDTAIGFTLLDTKGIPPAPDAPPATKAELIEHAYYRLSVVQPAGFTRRKVDPSSDKGIFLHLRARDEEKNVCEIRVRVFLAKTIKQDTDARAQARLDSFAAKYKDSKLPRKPKRFRVRGAEEAFRLDLAGRGKGYVITEDWRVIRHTNGRLYEVQLSCYGAAAKVWRTQIRDFWKKLKIRP